MIDYPFRAAKMANYWPIRVNIHDEKYVSKFQKRGALPTGHFWAALVETIIRETRPDLLDKLEFDPSADVFGVYATDQEAQLRVVTLLNEFFNDIDNFDKFLNKLDLSAID